MKLELEIKDGTAYIIENGHTIYTIEEEREDGLLSVYLKNMYGDEVLGMYQIQKWYSRFLAKRMEDFTIYEKDEKRGELHGFKEGYEIELAGVFYRFFGGYHATKRTIIGFDKDHQTAEFTLDTTPTVRFRNATFNPVFSLLLYLFTKHLSQDKFIEEAYLYRYKGHYQDTYEFES